MKKPCARSSLAKSDEDGAREDVYLILTCFMTLTDYCNRGRASAACNRRAVARSTLRLVSVSCISASYLFWESISETTEANNACSPVFTEQSAFR